MNQKRNQAAVSAAPQILGLSHNMRTARWPAQQLRELRAVGRVALVEQPVIHVVPYNVEDVHNPDKEHVIAKSLASQWDLVPQLCLMLTSP